MAYTPNPTDPTQPVDSVFASTAAAEFRSLKAYIQTLVLGTGQLAGNRNLARNGDFKLNQRSAGIVTANGAFMADGWTLFNNGVLRLTGTVDSAVFTPNFPQVIIMAVNAAGVQVTTDVYGMNSSLEGTDMAPLLYGTANAKVTTLSFKAFSNTPGTYSAAVRNGAANRSYVAPFTINLANTWETKTIVIPGDTAGTWPRDTGTSHQLSIIAAAGSTYQTPNPNVWQAGNFVGLTTQTQLTTIAAANLCIAEVQFEQSAFATPYEYLPMPIALSKAYRYYEAGGSRLDSVASGGGLQFLVAQPYRTIKRVAPTITYGITASSNTTIQDMINGDNTTIWHRMTSAAGGGIFSQLTWTSSAELP